MGKFLIRNDDVAFDTDIKEIKTFCQIADKYGYQVLHAITLIGECQKIHETMDNYRIKRTSFKKFQQNQAVVNFLQGRKRDLIAVHGLWHTHGPTESEIRTGKAILIKLGLNPTYFVPPFNEGRYPRQIAGLTTNQLSLRRGERLEDFLAKGKPRSKVMYLHSWRFNNNWYTFAQLDQCLSRLS